MASIPRFETIPTTETVKTSEHEDEHAEMTVGQKLKDFTHTITGEKLEGISETVKEAAIEIEEDAKRLGRLKDKGIGKVSEIKEFINKQFTVHLQLKMILSPVNSIRLL